MPKQRHGHKSRLYPRVSIQKLRDITLATPPDENWPTISTLEARLGMHAVTLTLLSIDPSRLTAKVKDEKAEYPAE